MISVIISTYNRAHLLPRAIDSVLSQTFQDFELLVIDDGSTDNTEEVVEPYLQKDKRVHYIKQGNSGGAARPKNIGIKKAGGEYIAILDSDDEWLPQKLYAQLHWFEESGNPNLRMVGCNVILVDSETKKESRYRILHSKDILRQLLLRDYMGPGSCMLYHRDVFQEVGLFDEDLQSGQDHDMRIRIAERYDIEFVDDYLLRYYINHDNVSTGLDMERLETSWEYLFQRYKRYYSEDLKLWSEKLRYDGTRYVLLGELQKGRRRFLESLQKNPLNFKSVVSLGISLLGRKAYEAVTKYKMLAGSRLPW